MEVDFTRFKFLITGTPRSGTAWLSAALSACNGVRVIHEPEVSRPVEEGSNMVIGCASHYPIIDRNIEIPESCVFIKRNRAESASSFDKFVMRVSGRSFGDDFMGAYIAKAEAFIRMKSPLVVEYSSLFSAREDIRAISLLSIGERLGLSDVVEKSINFLLYFSKFKIAL